MNKVKAISMFSGAGIGELYINKIGIDVVAANEIVKTRSRLYSFLHPKTTMLNGDINDNEIYESLLKISKENNCKMLLATPPCQGVSSLGKKDYDKDIRNFLIHKIIRFINDNDFDFILIENVPKYAKMYFPYKDNLILLEELLKNEISKEYKIEVDYLNAKDFSIPQSRPRVFIKIYKSSFIWVTPLKSEIITLKDAIGYLPSLESGEKSLLKWHNAKIHNERDIAAMRSTSEGKSALKNEIHYPKAKDGRRIKGFHNTFKRMLWDEPSPARAMNSGNIGGHNNVHPGRKLPNGEYSDARVLTLRELFIVSSINPDIELPEWTSENLIRQVIGESIPPMLLYRVLEGLKHD
jgi:DNA (cytosine-5)-methyltransferase 1